MIVRLFFVLSVGGFTVLLACLPVWADNERRGLDLLTRGQPTRAVVAWEKGASKGDAGAAYRAGAAYLSGTGVDKNIPKALSYLQNAADNNEPRAAFELAALYEKGIYVPVNMRRAILYYRLAAERGLAGGQYHYARLLELGFGLPDGFEKAYMFYYLSVRNVRPIEDAALRQAAYAGLARMDKKLATKEKARAKRAAQYFSAY